MNMMLGVPILRGVMRRLQGLLFSLAHRAVLDGRVSVFGWPIVTRFPGSTLRLGDGVSLVSNSHFSEPGISRPCIIRTLTESAQLLVGAESGLSGVTICAAHSVTIGEQCLIGADVFITDTDFHPVAAADRRYSRDGIMTKPVTIGANVFIGARSIVLKGVSIGADSVIGAGSVVTRDVPPGCIAAGVPARVVGRVPRQEHR